MEFAVCPSCKQSVLDDEAVDCPFCGAPMKGGPRPGGAPAKPTAAKPSTAAPGAVKAGGGAAAIAKPAAKPVSGSKAETGDETPFEREVGGGPTTAAAAAPTKQRSFRIVCPMCETVGYISPKAAGTRVKCANPKCLVPTFEAPPLPPAEPESPPEPPRKPNYVLLGGVTAAICLAGGAAAYFVAMQPARSTVNITQMTPEEAARLLAQTQPTPPVNSNITPPQDNGPSSTIPPIDKPPVVAATSELAKELPILIEKAVLIRGSQNRSLPFSRQLASESFALMGNIPKAQEHLAAFDRVGQNVPFYKISILTELAWAQLKKQDVAAAKVSAQAAFDLAGKLPGNGRSRLISASRLGGLLIALGELDKATQLANEYSVGWKPGLIDTPQAAEKLERQDGQVSALLQPALDDFTTTVAATDQAKPGLAWFEPQSGAMARSAAGRGFINEAVKWAAKQTGTRQIEVLGELAAFEGSKSAAGITSEALLAKVNGLMDRSGANLSPVARAYVLGRAATAVAGGSPEAAKGLVASARELLAGVTIPAPVAWPQTPGLVNPSLPALAPLEKLAVAWSELALASQLAGDTSSSQSALKSAFAATMAIGPSLIYVDQFLERLNGPDVTSIRDRLKEELGIRTEDAARQAFSSYRRGVLTYREHAAIRFDLELTIADRLIEAGGPSVVWKQLQESAGDSDAVQQQLPTASSANTISMLATAFQLAGDQANAQAVTDWYANSTRATALAPSPLLQAKARFAANDGAGAARLLKEADSPTRALATSLLASSPRDAASVDQALALLGQTADVSVREEASIFAAHRANELGAAGKILSYAQGLPQATERLAWIRGLSMPLPSTEKNANPGN